MQTPFKIDPRSDVNDGVRPQIAILIIASTIKLSSLFKSHFWRKGKGDLKISSF